MRPQYLKAFVPGAVLIVGIPADAITSNRARITAWQLVRLEERGSYAPLSTPVRNRRAAEALAQQEFPTITRWARIDSTTFLGVHADSADASPPA
jgi:hypothetical protein